MNPRHLDNWSQLEQYNIMGRFYGSNVYQDAIQLADLLKSHSGGTPLTLEIPLDEYPDSIEVAPSAGSNQAASIVYNPGRRGWVEVDVGLTRVGNTQGSGSQAASTPTASGSGPIQLSDGGATIDLSTGIEVERVVGRPNSQAKRSTGDYPNYIDKRKSAYEAFSLSLTFGSNTTQKVQRLRDMASRKLRRGAFTLDFNGLFGMGSFDVVPDGSGAIRHVRRSGYQGTTVIPTMNLRRVMVD